MKSLFLLCLVAVAAACARGHLKTDIEYGSAAGVSGDLITVENGRHGMATWDKLGSDYASPVVAWLQKNLQ